jgi:hypothetical protein
MGLILIQMARVFEGSPPLTLWCRVVACIIMVTSYNLIYEKVQKIFYHVACFNLNVTLRSPPLLGVGSVMCLACNTA